MLLLCLNTLAQDTSKFKKAIGIYFGGSNQKNKLYNTSNYKINYGITFGFKSKIFNQNQKNYEFTLLSIMKSSMIVNNIIGDGTVIELNTRNYFNKKEKKGFYSQSSISHGEIFFNKPNGQKVKYSYWSLIGLQFGGDFKISKEFSIDLNAGILWHWNKGFTDNISPFQSRGGISLMYNFY